MNGTAGGSRHAIPTRIIVISDLHIGAGRQPGEGPDPLEHFQQDQALAALLDRLARRAARGGRRAELILNGDIVDFVRVTRIPASGAEVAAWLRLLREAGVAIPRATREAAEAGRFSRADRRYGFDCTEPSSVWKLGVVARGHPRIFSALARWCAAGHGLVVIRGNHDSEWAWPGVRRAFRILLDRAGSGPLAPSQLRFRLRAYRRANLWVEHGHGIRWSTRPPRLLTAGRPPRLMIPVGSLMNRFVLNPMERLLEQTPGVPSSLRLKRLAHRHPWRLWSGVLRSTVRSFPSLLRALRPLWQHHARSLWPAYAGGAVGAGILALPLISDELPRSLALGSRYARAGAAVLAAAVPPAGMALVEIVAAVREGLRAQARAYALRRANAAAGHDASRERLVVLGHTHHADLHSWSSDDGRVVYANPGCWMTDGERRAIPRFFWCARRGRTFGKARVFEVAPGSGRYRSAVRPESEG